MKFKAKKDPLYICLYVLLIVCVILAIYFLLQWYINSIGNFFMLLLIALCIFLCGLFLYKVIYGLIKTTYSFEDDKLVIRVGNEITDIKLNRVMNLESTKRLIVTGAYTLEKLKITYIEGNSKETKFVSPDNKEEFINQLKIHCKSMKVKL